MLRWFVVTGVTWALVFGGSISGWKWARVQAAGAEDVTSAVLLAAAPVDAVSVVSSETLAVIADTDATVPDPVAAVSDATVDELVGVDPGVLGAAVDQIDASGWTWDGDGWTWDE